MSTLKLLKLYQVLHRLFHHCFQGYFLPTHKAQVMCIATCATFGVVRMTGPRVIVMGFVALISILYMSTIFRKMGLLYEESTQLKQMWLSRTRGMDRSQNSKYMRRLVQSQQEFRIDVGTYYFVKRSTVVTLIHSIIIFTVNLLVAY